jgi:hypothetical protein
VAEPLTTTLTCPQCGAENPLPSGQRLVECAFCDATLFVDRSGLVSHYEVPRLLGAEEAEKELRRWMAGNNTVKGLDREARIQSSDPLLFPVWMFRLRRSGAEVVRVEPAAPTAEPQLADLQVPAGQLRPYRRNPGPDTGEMGGSSGGDPGEDSGEESGEDSDRAHPVEALPAQVSLETARGWLDQREGANLEITETALVHLPLWQCRYLYRGATYSAMVDGSTGAVLASHFPAKSEGPFWMVAVFGVLLFLVEGLMVSNPLLKTALYGVSAVPLFLLAYWVAKKV